MYYTIYKTTCKTNGKIYIGAHKSKDLNDNYLGSGKLIQRAINKYGKDSFVKEILFVFDNEIDMFNKERELVTEQFVENNLTYNCKPGGEANWYYINKNGLNHKSNQHLVLRDRLKANTEYAESFSKKMSERSSFRTYDGRGENNSVYGKIWITNEQEDKMILPEQFDQYASNGYRKGKMFKKRNRKGKCAGEDTAGSAKPSNVGSNPIFPSKFGQLAQLNRASVYETEG